MSSELMMKNNTLEFLGFKCNCTREVYWHPERRVIISKKAVEKQFGTVIFDLMCASDRAPQWTFHFIDPPAENVKRQLIEHLTGEKATAPFHSLHSPESLCREIQSAIESKFDDVQYMHAAFVTCAETKENCVAVVYVMPLGDDLVENWGRLIDGLLLDRHYRKLEGAKMNLRKCVKRILYWRKTPEMQGEGAIRARFAFQLIYEEGECR